MYPVFVIVVVVGEDVHALPDDFVYIYALFVDLLPTTIVFPSAIAKYEPNPLFPSVNVAVADEDEIDDAHEAPDAFVKTYTYCPLYILARMMFPSSDIATVAPKYCITPLMVDEMEGLAAQEAPDAFVYTYAEEFELQEATIVFPSAETATLLPKPYAGPTMVAETEGLAAQLLPSDFVYTYTVLALGAATTTVFPSLEAATDCPKKLDAAFAFDKVDCDDAVNAYSVTLVLKSLTSLNTVE